MNFISDSIKSLNGRQLSQLLIILGHEDGAPGKRHSFKYNLVVDYLFSFTGFSRKTYTVVDLDRVILMYAAEKLNIWEKDWRELSTEGIIDNIFNKTQAETQSKLEKLPKSELVKITRDVEKYLKSEGRVFTNESSVESLSFTQTAAGLYGLGTAVSATYSIASGAMVTLLGFLINPVGIVAASIAGLIAFLKTSSSEREDKVVIAVITAIIYIKMNEENEANEEKILYLSQLMDEAKQIRHALELPLGKNSQ
jgi:hypothetical protein